MLKCLLFKSFAKKYLNCVEVIQKLKIKVETKKLTLLLVTDDAI